MRRFWISVQQRCSESTRNSSLIPHKAIQLQSCHFPRSKRIFPPCSGGQPSMLLLGQLVRSIRTLSKWRKRKEKADSQGEEVPRASTSPATFMEQVRHALRRPVEGTHWIKHPAQGLDGKCLELGQSSYHWPRNAGWCRDWEVPHLFGVEINGGCILLLRSNSRVPPKIEKQVTTNAANQDLCSRSEYKRKSSRYAPFKLLKVRSSPPSSFMVVDGYPALGRNS